MHCSAGGRAGKTKIEEPTYQLIITPQLCNPIGQIARPSRRPRADRLWDKISP